MANNDAHEPTANAASPTRRTAVLRVSLIAACLAGLFLFGAFASWMLRTPAEVPEPDSLESVEHPPPTPKIDRSGTAADLLQRGDDALLQFRHKIAIDYYQAFLEQAPSRAPFIRYRVALCFEFMDRNDDAIANFRTAIQANATSPLSFACHLGLARCLLRQGHPAEARRIFVPILLDEAKHPSIPPPMLTEARYLVALSLAQQAFTPATKKNSINEYLNFLAVELEPTLYLDEISKYKPAPNPSQEESAGAKIVLQKHADPAKVILFTLTQKEKNAKEVLDRVISEAGFQTEWSSTAMKHLDARTVQVSVTQRPLMEVIELLAEHFGVVWELRGNVIRFTSFSEMPDQQVGIQLRQMATRALPRALDDDATHPLAPAARLELGNIETASENTKEALKWYDNVLKIHPAANYALVAGYNQAQTHLRAKDPIQARSAFHHVIFRAPGHELAMKSQVRIGLLLLEEEKNQQAIAPLHSATILGPRSVYQPLAILSLATCHLRLGDYEKTRKIIATERGNLKTAPYSAMAIFLDAYAQYLLTKTTESHRRESADLLNALWNQTDAELLGPLSLLLFAQAYAELGLQDQAEKLLRQAALHPYTPLHDGIEFQLASILVNKNANKEARQIFSRIAEQSGTYRKQAAHQLAALDLQENRLNECVERCQAIWMDAPAADPIGLLQIWGGALERLGELKKAALCYSGKAPI